MLKKNLIANYFGQGWTIVMGLAFIPIYIKYLGMEAYGLIGFFALLQTWLSLLDMGLTPTIGREMARFTAGANTEEQIHDLLRSIELISLGIALFIASFIGFGSHFIATFWLELEYLPKDAVIDSIVIMGFVIAIRFMEGIYRSAIIGLQKQVLLNVISAAMATVRWAGAVFVLAWISPSIQAFFLWQGFISIVTLLILGVATYISIPAINRRARFSLESLRSILGFTRGMLIITVLTFLLTQVDKLIISKLLPLEDYGYYMLAAVVSAGVFSIITPITQAWYPKLCELKVYENQEAFIKKYHQGAQLVTILVGSISIALIFFSESFLLLWTGDEILSQRVAKLLSLLTLGNFLNSLLWIPYQAQLSYGWTSLTVKINSVAVFVVVPILLWVIPIYGAEGGAWVWAALNLSYVLVGIYFMHKKILVLEKWVWYWKDVALPVSVGISISLIFFLLWPIGSSLLTDIVMLLFVILLSLIGMTLAANQVRSSCTTFILKALNFKSTKNRS